jgi:hypothetical protein
MAPKKAAPKKAAPKKTAKTAAGSPLQQQAKKDLAAALATEEPAKRGRPTVEEANAKRLQELEEERMSILGIDQDARNRWAGEAAGVLAIIGSLREGLKIEKPLKPALQEQFSTSYVAVSEKYGDLAGAYMPEILMAATAGAIIYDTWKCFQETRLAEQEQEKQAKKDAAVKANQTLKGVMVN